MQRMRDSGELALSKTAKSNPLPSRFENHPRRWDKNIGRARRGGSLWQNGACRTWWCCTHALSVVVSKCTRPVEDQASQNTITKGGGAQEVSPWAGKAAEGERDRLLHGCCLWDYSCSRGYATPMHICGVLLGSAGLSGVGKERKQRKEYKKV